MSNDRNENAPFIEFSLVDQDSTISLKAPWTSALRFSLTLRNSRTPITISLDIFTSPRVCRPDHRVVQNWSLLDQEDGQEIELHTLFPDRISSKDFSDNDLTLRPDRPEEMLLFPFDSFDAEFYLPNIRRLRLDYPYILRCNVSQISCYSRLSKFASRVHRHDKILEGHAAKSVPIPVHTCGSRNVRFTESIQSPWIEVSAVPSASTLDLSNTDAFNIRLTLTLRGSEFPLVVPVHDGKWSGTPSLRQIGGWITYTDNNLGSPLRLRAPRMFINCSPQAKPIENLLWLATGSCFTLTPDQPLRVRQHLFREERTEHHISLEQFQEGHTYTVSLEHPQGVRQWLQGTVVGNVLWRVIYGYWWSGLQWERGIIRFFQTTATSFTVVKS